MIPNFNFNIFAGDFSFSHPTALAVGIAITLIIFLCSFSNTIRRLVGLSRSVMIIRAILIAILSLIIAHPITTNKTQIKTLIAAVDMSRSMDVTVRQKLLSKLNKFKESDTVIKIIPFGRNVGKSIKLEGNEFNNGDFFIPPDQVVSDATDLTKVLTTINQEEASAAFLLSDGFATEGNLNQLLSSAQELSIPLHIITDDTNEPAPSLSISQFSVPLTALPGEAVPLRVSVMNSFAEEKIGRLIIKQSDQELFNQTITIKGGEEPVYAQLSQSSQEGLQEIVATFTPNDKNLPPTTRRAFLAAQKRPKVLLLSGSSEDESLIKSVLTELGHELSLTFSNKDSLTVENYRGVILNNISHQNLPLGITKYLDNYVRSGGGLLVIGGNRSYGIGGYTNTTIGRLFPVESIPPKAEQKRINIALSLILDKSRSMASDDRLIYAREAAKEVINHLKDEDYIGVIGFDSTPFVVVRMGQLLSTRQQALQRIERLFPAGRTNLLPALDEARRTLENTPAGRKHIIVLTDGRLPDGGAYYIDIVRDMRTSGITVSTVLLGGDLNDGTLEGMAQIGGGNFYQTDSARSLPRIFLQDVMVSGADRTMEEESEFFVKRGSGSLSSTSLTSFPPLRGFVHTEPKPNANIELVLQTQKGDEPLLASWKIDKGKVVAFTSDANSRWSNFWAKWPKFSIFWGEILSSILPKESSEQISFGLRHFVELGTLIIEPTIYKEGISNLTASVVSPQGTKSSLTFTSETPGLFRGQIQNPEAGAYKITLSANGTPLPEIAIVLDGNNIGEQPWRGFNNSLLSQLATASRGSINPSPNILPKSGRTIEKITSLTSPLFALFIVTLLLEALIRIRQQ
jgi:Ca-activated chloride channel family protein